MERFDLMPDEQLLALAGRHADAFGVFYRRHESAVLVFFLRRTGAPETAADLAAETFAAALLSAARFRPGGSPAVAWLFGIAHHKLAGSLRRGRVESRARRRLRLEPLVLTDADLERVEALADAQRAAGILTALLEALPPAQRDAVRARVVDDRDYADIAHDLACSEAVVRQRVSRGLSTLRTQLSEEHR